MDLNTWTSEHYLAYICLSVASIDEEFANEEWHAINKVINFYLNDKVKSEDLIIEVYGALVEVSLEDKKTFLTKHIQNFKGNRELLRDHIEEVIMSDYRVDSEEMQMYKFIKGLLVS